MSCSIVNSFYDATPSLRSFTVLPGRRRMLEATLCICGFMIEGLVVAGIGEVTILTSGVPAASLPDPALVAAGYLALLLLQNGAANRRDAKIGSALRALGSAFVGLGLTAGTLASAG